MVRMTERDGISRRLIREVLPESPPHMPVLGITCSYVPEEIIHAAGLLPRRISSDRAAILEADVCLHSNVCHYARSIMDEFAEDRHEDLWGVLLVNSCDAMRRLYDALMRYGKVKRCHILDVPRIVSGPAVKRLSSAYRALATWLGDQGAPVETEALRQSIEIYNRRRRAMRRLFEVAPSYSREMIKLCLSSRPEEFTEAPEKILNNITTADRHHPFETSHPGLLIAGPVLDKEIIWHLIRETGAEVVAVESCTGMRHFEGDVDPAAPDPYLALADRYLKRVPCPRMADISGRAETIAKTVKDKDIDGVIYFTMKFCDLSNYDALTIKRILTDDIPFLTVEWDYATENTGQLATRIGAFVEMIFRKRGGAANKAQVVDPLDRFYVAGVDVGSLSTDLVIMDEKKNVIAWSVVPTGANGADAANRALESALRSAAISREAIRYVVSTGYGRGIVEFADEVITEISCHAKGCRHIFPQVRTIIDVGGQDSKVIKLNGDGTVASFTMNDKCAAGTGRFLEVMAKALGMELSEMAEAYFKAPESVPISNTCTVFAESEIISLIGRGEAVPKIVKGLCEAIVSRLIGMVKRLDAEGPYSMTGGVARNRGVVAEFKRRMAEDILVAEEPQIVGAIGAALFALEKAASRSGAIT